MKSVIFDLDGTLCDTLPDLCASMNYALRMFDLPPLTLEQARPMIGHGTGVFSRKAVPADRLSYLPSVHAIFSSHYAKNCVDRTKPYDGMTDTLCALKRSGFGLFVVTNKPEPQAKRIIGELFPSNLFECVMGAAGTLPPKPDPAMLRELMRTFALCPSSFLMTPSDVCESAAAFAEMNTISSSDISPALTASMRHR